jgi:hypothetical protein
MRIKVNQTAKRLLISGTIFILIALAAGCGTLFRGKEAGGKKGQPGWLTVSSKPNGVQLLIAGGYKYDVKGSPMVTPCTIAMEPGFYDLWLRLYEYQDWRDTVRIAAGETTRVNVPLIHQFDEAHRKKQGEAVFTLGTVLCIVLLTASLFMRNDFK